jgi:hypothetical protein
MSRTRPGARLSLRQRLLPVKHIPGDGIEDMDIHDKGALQYVST